MFVNSELKLYIYVWMLWNLVSIPKLTLRIQVVFLALLFCSAIWSLSLSFVFICNYGLPFCWLTFHKSKGYYSKFTQTQNEKRSMWTIKRVQKTIHVMMLHLLGKVHCTTNWSPRFFSIGFCRQFYGKVHNIHLKNVYHMQLLCG